MKKEEFIEKGKSIHGDIYDYSLIEIDPRHVDNVELICKTHGIFTKLVNNFLSGKAGCPKCGRSDGHKKSPEQFLKECQEVHGDTYDYSRLVYTGAEDKIIIGCRIHKNWFEKVAHRHLKGVGCPLCAQEGLRLTTAEFIQRSSEIHNNFYDYSETVYVHSSQKLLIQCPVHKKSFSQFPGNHLKGMGCPECGRQRISEARSLNQEDFLAKCKETHGDLYDYSNSVYTTGKNKVIISCRKHLEFSQSPETHWSGAGCPFCANERIGESRAWTQEQFVEYCTQIHGGFYNYDKTIYTGMGNKIIISCSKHGDYSIGAQSHKNGGRCDLCFRESTRIPKYDTAGFIERATRVHGDRYDYSLVDYKGQDEPMNFICKTHGLFTKTGIQHLTGTGCPSCNYYSRGEYKLSQIFIKNEMPFAFDKSFEDCRNPETGRKLFFDFYLEDLNTIIEYDGEQHFIAVEHWGGEESFIKSQQRDQIKTDYCTLNNIRLIRIPYTEDILTRLKQESIVPPDFQL